MDHEIIDGMPCNDEEVVLRAITSTQYDRVERRPQRSSFSRPGVSVSRETVLSREEIEGIFVDQLYKPPNVELIGVMPVHVARLREIGHSHIKHVDINVIQKPRDDNRAHAEIDVGLSKGLAQRVIDAFPVTSLLPLTNLQISQRFGPSA